MNFVHDINMHLTMFIIYVLQKWLQTLIENHVKIREKLKLGGAAGQQKI